MSIRNTYPTIRPSLNLDFARSRTLDPRITFSRTTTGTYMDSDGLIKVASADEARFDHRYVNGQLESLGLLVEEERSNIVRNSEDLTILTGRWSEAGDGVTVTTNQAVAPDGNTTADKVGIKTTDAGSKSIQSSILSGTSSGTVITSSIFCKADDHNYVRVEMQGGGNTASINVNLSDGSLISEVSSPDSHNIEPYPNDWYRISVTSTTANTSATALRVYLTDASGNTGFIGTVGNGVFMWGGQHEVGAFATSYIPTDDTVGGKTRNPDNVSMTGDNFSDWYNPTEGTIVLDCTPVYDNSSNQYRRLLSIHNNSGVQTDVIQFIQTETTNQVNSAVWDGSSFQTGSGKTLLSGTRYKVAFAVKENNMNASYDGSIGTDDTSATLPVMTEMDIGSYSQFSGNQATAHYNSLRYYPTRLTNAQLQNLTK